MKLSEFKKNLESLQAVNFKLPGGDFVPAHFHITEAGLVTKHFIDCGGTVRLEKTVTFQIWVANDLHHRIEPEKLLKIIAIWSGIFGHEDVEVEMEYQTETIGKYGLDLLGEHFLLTTKQTACLAGDQCGSPGQKTKLKLASLTPEPACCTPGGTCC